MATKKQSPDNTSERKRARSEDFDSTKKTKLENPLSAPKYGEQSYWEDRYKQLLNVKSSGDQESSDSDAPLAYHSWYFNYPEIKPILLPLLLGSGEDVQKFISESTEAKDDDEENLHAIDSDAKEKPLEEKEEDEEDGVQSVEEEKYGTEHSTTNLSGSEQGSDEDVEEIDSDDESENDEEALDRGVGLAAMGPIEILEIGCGDVPLLVGLFEDMKGLEQATGTEMSAMFKRIRCVDYSPTVIEKMKEQHGSKVHLNDKISEGVPFEFAVADGRKLEMENKSVDVIIEKGCLDGMLSDPKNGIENCRKMVSECARVLVPGGFLVIISHSNAHTEHGMEWLQDIVFKGLQRLAKVDPIEAMYKWEVEVHGNDMESLIEEYGDDIPDDASPGPAVYVIHKQSAMLCAQTIDGQDRKDSSAIKVKFLSY